MITNNVNKCEVINKTSVKPTESYSLPKTIKCIVGTGYTKHYIQNDPNICKTESQKPLKVVLSNGQIITSTTLTNLNVPSSSHSGNQAHIFNQLTSGSLLSVGQLYDDGHQIIFTNNMVKCGKITEHISLEQKIQTMVCGQYISLNNKQT